MNMAGLVSSPAMKISGARPKRSPTMMAGARRGSAAAAQSLLSLNSGTVITSPYSPRCMFSEKMLALCSMLGYSICMPVRRRLRGTSRYFASRASLGAVPEPTSRLLL